MGHIRMRVHPFHVVRINKMLSCAGADAPNWNERCLRQTPRNRCPCPHRTAHHEHPSNDKNRAAVIESLRRAKFKYPGRQKIFVSKKWGFTKFERSVYEKH